MRTLGITFNPMFDGTDTFGWAISFLASRIATIDFDQHGVIDIRTERAFDRLQISFVPTRAKMNQATQRKAGREFARQIGKFMRESDKTLLKGVRATKSAPLAHERRERANLSVFASKCAACGRPRLDEIGGVNQIRR